MCTGRKMCRSMFAATRGVLRGVGGRAVVVDEGGMAVSVGKKRKGTDRKSVDNI